MAVTDVDGRSLRRAGGRAGAGGTSVVLLVALAAGCGGRAAPADTTDTVVAQVTRQGVAVEIRWTDRGDPAVSVTFTPLAHGFHLYGASLPPGGVGGVGRPTLVTLGGGLVATGPPKADRPERSIRVAGLDRPVPVYPDGPVTLQLPARRASSGTSYAQVSYAACSTATCLPPVDRLRVPLSAPAAG